MSLTNYRAASLKDKHEAQAAAQEAALKAELEAVAVELESVKHAKKRGKKED